MEISLVLTDDSGSYQAILGQFIETSAASTLADRQLAQTAAAAAAQSESNAADSESAAAAAASAASDSAASAATDAVQTADDRTDTNADATAAAASAADASASAGTASAQAADAAASASAAGTSETNAAASAADAAATLANALVKANNLSDVADAATSLSNLGGAAKSANLSDLASAATARNNLGLGTSATVNTGTSGAAIPLLNAANTWALLQTFTLRPMFNGSTPWDSDNLDFTVPPAIGTVTPAAAAFTTLSVSGLITPSSTIGIRGTTTNDNANAGSIGEFPVPTNLSNVAATSTVALNVASITLTAGDWDVSGLAQFNPAAATTSTLLLCGVSKTSGVRGTFGAEAVSQMAFSAGLGQVIPTPTVRIQLAAPATVYIVAEAVFTGGAMTVSGFIRARRIR